VFTKLFARSEEKQVRAQLDALASELGIKTDRGERRYLDRTARLLVRSPLGGKYVHPAVYRVICLQGIMDSLFSRGAELLERSRFLQAKASFEKAKNLIPWPTVHFALGLLYYKMWKNSIGQGSFTDEAINATSAHGYLKKALNDCPSRVRLLRNIVPESVPDREHLIEIISNHLDNQSLRVGVQGIADLGDVTISLLNELEP
jgi:hypothetical protein